MNKRFFMNTLDTQPDYTPLRELLLTPTFVMCQPKYISEANDGTNAFEGHTSRKGALEEWFNLKALIEELGGRVIEIPATEGNIGQVYTADFAAFSTNVTFTDDNKILDVNFNTLSSRFTNTLRTDEGRLAIPAIKAYETELFQSCYGVIEGSARTKHETSSFAFEGSGDSVLDPFRGIFLAGYSNDLKDPKKGRTDKRAHKQLARVTDRDILSLPVDNNFFHIDTSQMPLDGGYVLSYRGGVMTKSYNYMCKKLFADYGLDKDEYLIQVSAHDAAVLASNVIEVKPKVLIVSDEISMNLAKRLENAGFELHGTTLINHRNDGGAGHCIANKINVNAPLNGTQSDPQYREKLEAALC